MQYLISVRRSKCNILALFALHKSGGDEKKIITINASLHFYNERGLAFSSRPFDSCVVI